METRTEKVLPQMVDAVQGDLRGVADVVAGAADTLESLESQLRHDRETATLVRGVLAALRTYSGNLNEGADDYGRRVLPAPQAEPVALRVERGAA